MKNSLSDIYFINKTVDKSELKKLITWAFRNYGIARASSMADSLKDLGFYYATKAGISLSLEDLRIPPSKQNLLDLTFQLIQETDKRYEKGQITAVERFQKVIDTWNYASENLKKEVIQYFKNTDPLNSIYMMAFSGARANISQVKQLVGMRGLMADPQGQIIDLPIFNNFREGLTVTDYFISSYGARKGLVDTALRTADSGYLTRRLVDVAQDIIIREYNCNTSKGILLEEMIDNQKTLISIDQALLGRVLAEDLIDINQNKIIAKANESIDSKLAEKIAKLNLRNILIRSPLTCASLRSVCQLCYGWNLAHGKIVDLGEAIGIIAAQSIGEPGTQLTMRTFHTGGVFTGEISQNLISSSDGIVKYPENINSVRTRNRHGDNAILLLSDCIISIYYKDTLKKENHFSLLKGALILVNNNQLVKQGQIIAEYPINNKLSTEKAQKAVLANCSGSVHFNDSTINQNMLKKSIIVWVLNGEVYNLPKLTRLLVLNNQIIQKDSLLARTQLLSHHDGKIYLLKDRMSFFRLLLVTSSKLYNNLRVSVQNNNDYKKYFLETDNGDKFILKCQPNKRIIDQQVIGDLVSNIYKTKTGGIIKYLDLSLSRNDEQGFYNIYGSGYILWIPEETHVINKDASLLLVNNSSFIEAGTEIIQNVFSNNPGFLDIIEKDGIVREIIIKPGQLCQINLENQSLDKYRGFLRPGESLLGQITTNKLVYWEYVSISNNNFILLRPVTIYSVPKKNLFLRFSDSSFATELVNLKLVRRTCFKDGERVKSISGIDLLSIHLVIELQNQSAPLKCYMQLHRTKNLDNSTSFLVKFITADFLTIKDSYFNKNHNLYTKTNILVKDGDYIKSNSIISQTDIFSHLAGKIGYIEDISMNTANRRILIISNASIYKISLEHQQFIKVKLDSWVYAGDEVATNTFSEYSGRVININNNQIIIRIGQPYLISSGSFLHINNNSLIKKGENIATLIFDRFKTGDIVQGLPRIEEILEARKKIELSFNPHSILESKFISCLNQGLSVYNATRLSILEIQLFLVKEVQSVYQSQGVYIADKHIEVIVRQMTSKVKIENGGNTEYLPGEIVELQRIEAINKSLMLIDKKQASYYPILLGITKASLNTSSFISAASFQETTKVLTDAAISGKLDWLRGLKENVIIGRLIPAGTGFNTYNSKKIHQDIYSKIKHLNKLDSKESCNLSASDKINFEDIIVDDRISTMN
uniref:DNA-directed RNA polymerase subunit beta'' n=1 Tax=Digenea simplex TaxID=945030 RepID=A0A1Z1MUN3_DIGSM|nr:RNA polymerase b''''-subunit [Digenea simplex]ARW69532.1 RNA polymerase b''''-subunit [Digenea simplex]